jgi:hypothetical protein
MQVQLDNELWEVDGHVSLQEVLADLSDRAHAKGRLVTKLVVGERSLTDRELIPQTLSRPAKNFQRISAVSERMEYVVQQSEDTARKFVRHIHQAGVSLVENMRAGRSVFPSVDQWFGQMADYLEWAHNYREVGKQPIAVSGLQGWVEELLRARDAKDQVRMADILEYEILPVLAESSGVSS